MSYLRQASERGVFDFGWLKTAHTFSFGEYRDPNHMGFHNLRVINEDQVEPGKGFGTHPHQNMEIVTYVLDGALEHKDSMGNGSIIQAGDVQRMSAGTGVTHSEFNHSQTEPVHFFQLWILPSEQNIKPGYEQKHFDQRAKKNQLRLVASQNGAEDSVSFTAQARLYASVLEAGQTLEFNPHQYSNVWIQMAQGELQVNDQALQSSDGLGLENVNQLQLKAIQESHFLVFELK